jgi:hypothetical protein
MIYTCETCDQPFKAKPSERRRYCSRGCKPHRYVEPENSELEQLAIRYGRALARELETRFLDLFTGPRSSWTRSVVVERVRRVTDVGTPAVCAAVTAVLVTGNRRAA